tara:strand:+ start:605 stop:1390 length:786 start_codon:yes stop_codon:yes gene_type:complete
MWIDSNTYIGHWPFRQVRNSTCKDLVERMDANGISASVLTNINGIFYKDTQAANRETYDEIKTNRKWADRLIPFAVINPVYSGWKADLKESTSKLGMKGVRIFPKYHRYNLDHPACIELVKMCRDMGIPVGLTLRMVDSRPSSWLDISNEWRLSDIMPIVKAVPDAKFMVLNVAGSTQLEKEDLALIKKTDLFLDTSGRNIIDLGGLMETFGKEKFGFGTHSPILDYKTGALRIASLREDEADAKTREDLQSGNIKRFLGL